MTIATTGSWEYMERSRVHSRARSVSTPIAHAIKMLGGFLITFIAIDLTIDRLPLPHIYGSRNIARWKCELFERAPRPTDVVFIGCSYEWCGISPQAIDNEVRNITGHDIRSMNLSASAASSLTQFLIVRRVLESTQRPKLVYLGVSPASLDASRRWWLINGLRALGRPQDLKFATSCSLEVIVESVRTALFRSYRQWDDVRMMANRFVIGAPQNPIAKLRDDDHGWAEWTGPKRSAVPPEQFHRFGGDVDEPPLLPRGDTGGFTTAEHKQASGHAEPREAPSFAGDFSAGNVNATALRETVNLLRAHGVAVRLLEMPLAPAGPIEEDPKANANYRQLIDMLATELHVSIVREPDRLIPMSDFFDPVHMDADGAARFSRWLAKDVAKSFTFADLDRPATAQSW